MALSFTFAFDLTNAVIAIFVPADVEDRAITDWISVSKIAARLGHVRPLVVVRDSISIFGRLFVVGMHVPKFA